MSSGAALCLKALVDPDNWRFASDDTVNKVCQNVAGALEESPTQTNTHMMSLVMALGKHNSLIVEAYARLLLIQSGLRILSNGIDEPNSQKRLVVSHSDGEFLDEVSGSQELILRAWIYN